jgi:hypothetical protein
MRRGAIRFLRSLFWAFAEGSIARVHLTMYQNSTPADDRPEPGPIPDWHPERVVPLSELPAAEQRWWRNLEERLR